MVKYSDYFPLPQLLLTVTSRAATPAYGGRAAYRLASPYPAPTGP